MNFHILKQEKSPPSPNVKKVLANAGQTVESSIADLIDNSLAHGSKNIYVNFKRDGIEDSRIEILDDGDGMNYDDLSKAMEYAFEDLDEKRNENDLGRYGVGMKTSSEAFCEVLQVISRGSDGETHSFIEFSKATDWNKTEVECDPNEIKTKTGTKIIWHQLKLLQNEEENNALLTTNEQEYLYLCDKIESHLAAVFCFFIENGVSIFFNDNKIDSWNPFKIPKGDVATISSDDFSINESKVIIKSFLIPTYDKMNQFQQKYSEKNGTKKITDMQGIYFYRSGRLVYHNGWADLKGLNVSEKFNYARIGVWFEATPDMDKYFRVDFNKNSVFVPVGLAEVLTKIAKKVRQKSQNSYEYRKNPAPYKKKKKEQAIPVWEVTRMANYSSFKINVDHPLIQGYTAKMPPNSRKALFALLEKEFPINELKQLPPEQQQYSKEEIKTLFDTSYKSKKESGKSFEEIRDAIVSERPFSEEKYLPLVHALLLNKKEEEVVK